MWKQLAWLALAGAAGTLLRYATTQFAIRAWGPRFPWGTVIVNGLGCLLFGLIWTLGEQRLHISAQTRLIVLTGFMGAFTTFSTFAFESYDLYSRGQWALALANLAGQNCLGILCIACGIALGKSLG